MSESPQEPKPSSYVVLLSGTHVTGKETLAVSLSQALSCPWQKAHMIHTSATFGAHSQAKKGYNYSEVFGRIWVSKMRRAGFLSNGNESDRESEIEIPKKLENNCKAIITCNAMRKPARDAIRDVMLAHSIKTIFVIMHITTETLSGRTLGAEEPELAKRIMGDKIADIEEPLEEETDVILIDSIHDVNTSFFEIKEGISRRFVDL